MGGRITEKRTHHHRREADEVDAADTERVERASAKEDLKHDLDELLDEIDSVLEENAEEFVQGYVQKGGQ
ncbi:MAG TPA: ubiquitin-like protein Pup [Actinomycetota bacterium]